MTEPTSPSTGRAPVPAWVWPVAAALLAALDLRGHIFVGWIPHDEGALAMGAALVRAGAWPHRDFSDIYTGGLAVLGAAAQTLFGNDLRALRILFFICTIGWVALLAVALRRFLSPLLAAVAALLAYTWGPPLYAAAMPSWFLLFLATLLLWTLFRWHEIGHRGWLFAAGATIGAALLIKINALFLLAGAGCALLLPLPPASATTDRGLGGVARATAATLGVLGALLLLRSGWPLGRTIGIGLPMIVLAAVGGTNAARQGERLLVAVRARGSEVGILLAGVLAVVGPWVAAYLVTGAGHELWVGVLVLPFRRVAMAKAVPPALQWRDLIVTGLFLTLMGVAWRGRDRRLVPLLVIAGLVGVLASTQENGWIVVSRSWHVARVLGAALIIAAGLTASRRAEEGTDRTALAILAWITAWFAMVQYPFAAPVYLAYVAPLMLATGAAVMAAWRTQGGVAATLGLSVLVLGVAFDHGESVGALGRLREGARTMAPLPGPRAGILVPVSDSAEYDGIDRTLDAWHATRIIAGPDAPEVYYLTGRPMLDREFFEFFAPDWSPGLLATRARRHRAEAVVLNTAPGFSTITVDSVVEPLGRTIIQDTLIGRFRLLRLDWTDASP